jgi:hypothetical protein
MEDSSQQILQLLQNVAVFACPLIAYVLLFKGRQRFRSQQGHYSIAGKCTNQVSGYFSLGCMLEISHRQGSKVVHLLLLGLFIYESKNGSWHIQNTLK